MPLSAPGWSLAGFNGPTPPDGATATRWRESARRRRMLEGSWVQDLRDRLAEDYGPTRRRRMGVPESTKNLFRSAIVQLSIMYDREPVIDHPDAAAAETMRELVRGAGLWQLSKQLQQLVVGQREAALRVDVVGTGPEARLLIRVVPADMMAADAGPDNPDVPHTVCEYRQRWFELQDGTRRLKWTRDCLSIEDDPEFRVLPENGPGDLSGPFLGGALVGPAYPYRDAEGDPILPYVLYHAVRTGALWDPFRGIELVDGTLTVASLWTQWRHLVRDASWPQRYSVNARIVGLQTDSEQGDAYVETDSGSLLQFSQRNPGAPVQLGQFDPGGDPESLGRAIQSYAADLLVDFDIGPADIAGTHTDRRSGYAIEITREGQRSAQRRFEPSFRRGDLQTLSVIASLWNAATGAALPESGWTIEYLGLPLSMEERRLMLEQFREAADLGVTSKPVLLARLEGITEEEARERLRQFRADAAEFPTNAPRGRPIE